MESLQELLVEELKDLYSAENQIIKALPEVIEGAASQELKTALTDHLEVTKAQVARLDTIFGELGEEAQGKHCKGMQGLLEEGAEALEEEEKGELRDLQLIGAAQRVEHYEVAAYGTAKTIAGQLGLEQIETLLTETLTEEEEADDNLTEVAERLYEQVRDEDEDDELDELEASDDAEEDDEDAEAEEAAVPARQAATKKAPR